MRRPRRVDPAVRLDNLLLRLIAVSGLVGLIVFFGVVVPAAFGDWSCGILFFTITPILAVLIGIWAVMGGKLTPWRFVCVVVPLTAWIGLEKTPGFDGLFLPFLFQVIATGLPLFIARAAGVRFEHVSQDALNLAIQMVRSEEGSGGIEGAVAKPRCSLWSLMSWTTAVALLFGSLGTLHVIAVPWDDFSMREAACAAVLSLIAMVALWITLADRWQTVRIIALSVVILGFAISVIAMVGSPGWAYCYFARLPSLFIIAFVIAAWLVGVFYVVRLAGYRLVRQ